MLKEYPFIEKQLVVTLYRGLRPLKMRIVGDLDKRKGYILSNLYNLYR